MHGGVDKVWRPKWKTKTCGHDANDHVRPAIQLYHFVYNLWISIEILPPHVITQNNHIIFPWLIFTG